MSTGLGSFLKRLGQPDRHEETADAVLVQQFLNAQDAAAFETLVRRHGPLVLRVCQRELPRLTDAEDAFQATFLVLAQKAHRIRDLEALPGWLAGVARRLARRLAQQLRRRREQLASLAPQPPASSRSETPAWWDEERRRLPEEYRAVIDLCLLQGLTRDEAALRLGLSASAVHGLLYRARLKLKKQLVDRGALAGALVPGAQATAAVIDRWAPALAQAAVQVVKSGHCTEGLLTTQALSLAQHGAAKLGTLGVLLAGGLVLGTVAWSGWRLVRPGAAANVVALAAAPTSTATLPPTQPLAPDDSPQGSRPVSEWNNSAPQPWGAGQSGGNTPRQQQTLNENAPRQQRETQSPSPQPPPPQQAQTSLPPQIQGGGWQGRPRIPVPPADRVPTGSERLNLAKNLVSSSGTLHQRMLPRLPNATRQKVDGKELVISLITSQDEFDNCTPREPSPPLPPNVSSANDPAWDGSMFRPNWKDELLLVVVLVEEANSVTLTPLRESWIAPDEGGVGHLLLQYDGPEPAGKAPWVQYPYVMTKVPRKDLKQIAVSLWRPTDKPAGVVTLPAWKK
jgi:RNA polymerase sigma factor (sigma-70 family)